MSDCFDHEVDAFDSMDQDYDYCGKVINGPTDDIKVGNSCLRRNKVIEKKSKWIDTEIEAKVIDGKPHVEHNDEWVRLTVPAFVRGTKLSVHKDHWVSRQHLMANQITGHYDRAGCYDWVHTDTPGTKMGNVRYAWNGRTHVSLNFPAWINPETNTVSVPEQFVDELAAKLEK